MAELYPRKLSSMRKLLALTIAILGFAVIGRGQQTAPRAVHLTLHEGTNMAAALSPDRRTIAIDLLGTLWTLPADGGTATAITDIFLDVRQPSWSPGARRIAFPAFPHNPSQICTVTAHPHDLKPLTPTSFP